MTELPPVADLELDARGLRCPMPLLKARQAMRDLQAGQVLCVRATDIGAKRDIPAWIGQSPHQLVQLEEGDAELVFWVRAG